MDEPKIKKADEELREEIKKEVMAELSETHGIILSENMDQDIPESEMPWAVFAINDTEYAINSKYVLCFEILKKITRVPDAPRYCPGFTESRGDLINLLDMRALFDCGNYLSAKAGAGDAPVMMVIIEIDGKKHGMIVDKIISVESITNFAEGMGGDNNGTTNSQYIRQIARRDKLDSPVLIIRPESLSEL